jgi:glycogen operon protein
MKKLDEGFKYQVKEGIFHCPGVRKQGTDVCYTVAVPDGKRCSLLLYEKNSGNEYVSVPMGSSARYGDLRSVTLADFPVEKYEYNYKVEDQILTDPYARQICGREVWGAALEEGSLRAKASFEEYDWQGDEPLHIPYEDVVAYATHVRGFTKHPSSRVKAPGTFAGVMEKIPYLKDLGINQLELMPVYEFAEIPEPDRSHNIIYYPRVSEKQKMNYWGYTKSYYFAPKASYSATGDPVKEMKDLVRELHRNGMELILEFYFPRGTKAPLILDCIKYWVLEYHIDGIHVNRDYTPVEALAQEPLLGHTKIMTESFRLDEIYEEGQIPASRNLAEYNDGFMMTARRFLKGDEGQLGDFVWRARRNPAQCGVINYMANHNGFTLMDLVSYDEKHNEANGEENRDGSNYNYSWNCGVEGPSRKKDIQELRSRQLRNALVLLLLSQGTPLIYGGDECGNSQSGNNNVYCQDNELSWVDWKPGRAVSFLPEYTRKLIAFRRAHAAFRQPEEFRMTDYLSCGYPDVSYHSRRAWFGEFESYNKNVGVLYAGHYNSENTWFYVAYNMHWTPREFALPLLPEKYQWRTAIDTGVEGAAGIYPEGQEIILKEQRTVTVPERTVIVLTGRRA